MAMAINKKRNLLFNIIVILLIIVVVELGLHLIVGIKNLVKPKKNENPLSAFYKDKEMAKKLLDEINYPINHHEYNPFLGWNVGPFKGNYVTTDLQLGRKTWHPDGNQHREIPIIFFFGGSAAWGFGVRNDYTIPSEFAKMLHAHGYNYTVFNYGEPGYTFKQGVMHLILLLREGRRPTYVIFYDGFNEIYAAHQHGIAGTVHNKFMTRERLKLKYREVIWNGIKEALRKYCMIYKSINGLYM